jgi:hypothetical protein
MEDLPMKTALLAAALLCSGAALAQDYSTTTTTTTAATGQVVAPGNTAPERDARGIPVISDPAIAPPGFNQAPGMNGVGGPLVDPSQPPAPMPATTSYPACSRTVTDHCVQTYERGVRRPR